MKRQVSRQNAKEFGAEVPLEREVGTWFGKDLWVMDFEGASHTSVVEAGVVRLSASGEVSSWTGLFAPLRPQRWEEVETHGLRDEELRGYPYFRDSFSFFRKMREGGVFAAHSASVENRFLRDSWPLPGLVPDPRATGKLVSEWGPWIDSLALARRVLPGRSEYGLRSLVEALGLTARLNDWAERFCPPSRRCYHAALFDALASWLILLKLAKVGRFQDWELRRLLHWQNAPIGSEGAEQLNLLDL